MARIVRVRQQGDASAYGLLSGDNTVQICRGTPFTELVPESQCSLDEIKLAPPVEARKMVAIWRNSRPLIESLNVPATKHLCYVIKPSTSFIGHGDTIVLPRSAQKVIFEAELGIVIGRRCKDVEEVDASTYVLGWTIVNEVTAIDVVHHDAAFPHHGRAKSFDTFGVFGPFVDTDFDPRDARIRTWQNGELRQDYRVSDLVRSPFRIIQELSRDMTLEPGDVIACGSSLGVAPMKPADVIDIEIDKLGHLRNFVRAQP